MRVLTYELALEQPLLAAARIGDPNSSVSLDYVPGSLLRGCLVHRYCERHGVAQPLDDARARRLFFDGQVRFLNAYPLTHDRARTVPTPRSVLVAKGADLSGNAGVFNAAHEDWDDEAFREAGDLRVVTRPFWRVTRDADRDDALFYTPERQLTVHIQRNREKGRAMSGDGQVFQYSALAPMQRFGGAILIDDASGKDEAAIAELLQPELAWLGGSRSAGYGKTVLAFGSAGARWSEVSGRADSDGRRWTLTLLSDLLLRDPEGSPVGVPDHATFGATLARELGEAVGAPVEIMQVVWSHTFTAPAEIGGFNRTWRMPLVQTTGLVAGSVITFVAGAALSAAQLHQIEWRGLGQRRAEGFGRVALNQDVAMRLSGGDGELFRPERAQPPLPAFEAAIARSMAGRLRQEAIARGIATYIHANVGAGRVQLPNRSQLAWLQGLVQQALATGDISLPLNAVRELKSVALNQFERARFDGQPFNEWVLALLTTPEDVWRRLGINADVAVGGQRTPLDDDAGPTALRLLSAVLTAARRAKEVEA